MRSFRLALLLMIALPLWGYAQDAADQSLPKEYQRANTPKTDVIVPKSQNQLKEFLNSVENMERHLAAQAQKHEAALRAVRQEVETTASSHVGFMSWGLTGLALFAGTLGVLGVVITYLMARTYTAEIQNKKLVFEKCESEIKNLLEKAKSHEGSLSELVKRHELSDKFKQSVLERAKETIKNGKGLEVVWGFAILAQENEDWAKALSFWKSILQENPRDRNALFGAAIASYKRAKSWEKSHEERVALLEEALGYLENISSSEASGPVLNKLGLILGCIAEATLDQEKRKFLYDQAEEKHRRATEMDPKNASIWFSWGFLLAERAKDSKEATDTERLRLKAEEKYRRATEMDPKYVLAWSSWGLLLINCAKDLRAEDNQAQKKYLLKKAEDLLERAVALGNSSFFYDLALLAAQQQQNERCIENLEKAYANDALPAIAIIKADESLASVRDTEDFKAFIEKVRRERER